MVDLKIAYPPSFISAIPGPLVETRNSKSSEHQKDFFTCKDAQLYPVSRIVVCCTGYLGLLDAPLRTALVKSRLSTWGEKKPFN